MMTEYGTTGHYKSGQGSLCILPPDLRLFRLWQRERMHGQSQVQSQVDQYGLTQETSLESFSRILSRSSGRAPTSNIRFSIGLGAGNLLGCVTISSN